jgi:hypothetical protein
MEYKVLQKSRHLMGFNNSKALCYPFKYETQRRRRKYREFGGEECKSMGSDWLNQVGEKIFRNLN